MAGPSIVTPQTQNMARKVEHTLLPTSWCDRCQTWTLRPSAAQTVLYEIKELFWVAEKSAEPLADHSGYVTFVCGLATHLR